MITTACNGAGELLTDGQEGYVVTEPGAIGELTAALDHMTHDAERAADVPTGHAARARAIA